MKHIKKILFTFVLIICSLAGCAKDRTEKEKTDREILDEFTSTIKFEQVLSTDLDLKSEYTYLGKTITAIWESSDERVVTNSGTYYHTLSDIDVELLAEFTLNEETSSQVYYITSLKNEDCLEEAFNKNFKDIITDENLELASNIKYGRYNFIVSYISSNLNALSNQGVISHLENDTNVTLTINLTYLANTYSNTVNVLIKAFDKENFINEIKKLDIPSNVDDSITLPNNILYNNDNINITWESSNINIISNTGIINQPTEPTKVALTCKSILNTSFTFEITVTPMKNITILEKVVDTISIPSLLSTNILLPTAYQYGTTAIWTSSNSDLLSNTGVINKEINKNTDVKLTLVLNKGEEKMIKTYDLTLCNEKHFYQDRTFTGEKNNLKIENNKLVLNDDALTGTYTTPIIETDEFIEAVASYAATSSKTSTCEVMVRLYVNNTWSKYFTYGVWGQGLINSAIDQDDTYASLSTDELIIKNSYTATAFQMKINLKRNNLSTKSPIVSLLALAIKFKSYTYNVDISSLPIKKVYDVPCLYQHDVPSIGNIICSATSSTMLLKYKGHNFTNEADYEHQYIASIVKDNGNDIYGNWVYNTIGMSSFGEISYVKRFYSANEMIYNLAKIGPMAASIKGTTITNKKTYTTNGHLIVVTGYETKDNETLIYINDPNVVGVSVTMTLDNFLNVYRMISYIIE